MKPRVKVIATGGTISKKVEGPDSKQKMLGAEDLLAMIPEVGNVASIEFEDFSRVSSPYMTVEDAFSLANRIKDVFRYDPGVAGIVVTHGTSSLEETAFLSWLLIDDQRPVVFTGAMRPPKYVDTDGPKNMLNSILIASSEKSREKGVMVCLNNEINSARYVRKTHTISFATFKSGEYGLIGYVARGQVIFFNKQLNRLHIKTDKIDPNVDHIRLSLGSGTQQIRNSMAGEVSGIVVEAMGGGNMPPWVIEPLIEAVEQGIVVVVVSRCDEGSVGRRPVWVENSIVSGGDLDGLKARLLLCLLVAKSRDPERIQEHFDLLTGLK